MNKQLSCTSLCGILLLFMMFFVPVNAAHAQERIKDSSQAASDMGLNSGDYSLGEEESSALERAGCDPNVYKSLMTDYANNLNKAKKEIQEGLKEPPPVADLSCLGDQLEDLWSNAEDIMSKVKGGFANGFDIKGLFNGALDSIKSSIQKKKNNLAEFACRQAEGLKDFILNQGQCFDFSKMFRWDKVNDFDFKGCLISAKFSLNNNGFQYSMDSDFFSGVSASGGFGFDDKLLLGDRGVDALFDSWNPVDRGTFNDSFACQELDPAFETAQANGQLNLFNPASQLRYNDETGELYWEVASAGPGIEERSSCYNVKMSTDAPAGTCYVKDDNGTIQRSNTTGLPKLYASIANGTLCNGTNLSDPLNGTAQSSTNSNVTCLGTNAFADSCGTGASVACCDPALQDCSTSTVPMCYCAYPTQSNTNPPLEITMWQTMELPADVVSEYSDWAEKWGITLGNPANPTDDILVASTCSAGLIENCCNPELNDCEGNPMLSTMPVCLDESKICVDLTHASIVGAAEDSNGDGVYDSTTMDLTTELEAKDLFSLFDYLVIEPDAQIHAYAEEDQSPSGQQRDVQCCATEWCNICPDMVRGAWRIRDELNMFPSDIGVANNKFVVYTDRSSFNSDSKVGVDTGNIAGYFASYATGNVYAKRDSGRTATALQADIMQPPLSHCLNIEPVPAEVIECAHIKRKSGFWNSTGFGQFLCDFPVLGSIFKLFGANCDAPSDPCEDVVELPNFMQAYEPELLQEGLPIANIKHEASWEGEDPKLCSDYATCEDLSQGVATSPNVHDYADVTSDNLEDYPEEDRPVLCAYLCDTEGVSSEACVSCAPEYLSCPLDCTSRRAGRTPCTSCVQDEIISISKDEDQVSADYCVSICENDATSLMCRTCGPEYGCTVCASSRLSNQCQSCMQDVMTNLNNPEPDPTTDQTTDPMLDRPTKPELTPMTTTPSTNTTTSGGSAQVPQEMPAQQLRTPSKVAPAEPTWKEQPSVAPATKPAPSSSGGGIKDVLKGLF